MAWDDFPSVEVLESAEPDTRESQWGSFPDATDEYRSIQRAAPLFDEQSRRDLMDSEPDAWSLPGKTREQQQFKLQRLLQEDVSRRADDPKYDDLVEDRRAQRRLLGRMPFVGAASEVPRLLRVRDASERLNNGKATEQDLLDIQEFVSESRDRQQEHEDSPIASQVKETLAALPGFVTEFVATGGLYAGAKKATEKTLTKLGRGAVEKGVVSRLAGVGAQSLANPQMIARSAAQTALDETLQGGDTSFLEALPSGLVDTLAELGSERSGGRVGDLAGKIPGVRALHGRIAAMWLRLNPDKGMTEFLRATATKAGWNGVLGEMGEERVGDLIRGSAGTAGLPGLDFGTVGDVSAGQRGLWWSGEQKDIDRGARGVRSLTAEGLSFGVPSAAGAALTAGPNVSNWLRGRGPLLTPPEPSGAVPDETVGDAPPVAGETPDLESQLLQFAEMAIPSRKLLDSPDVMQFIVDRMPQFERVRGLEPDVQMAEAARILKSSNNRRMAQSWLRRELKRMGVADSFNTGEGVIPDEEQEGQGGEVRQVADEPSVDDPAAGAEDGSVPAADRDYEAADAAVKAEYAGYSDRQLELASERLSSGEDERSKTVLGFVRAEQEKRKNSATNVGSQPPVVVEGGDSGSTGSSTPVVNAPEPVVNPGSIRVESAVTAPADQAPASVEPKKQGSPSEQEQPKAASVSSPVIDSELTVGSSAEAGGSVVEAAAKPDESPIKAAIRAEMERKKAEQEEIDRGEEARQQVERRRRELAGESPADKPKKQGSPKDSSTGAPKPPRSKLGQKTQQAAQNAEERTKAALEKWKQEMGDLGVLSLPGVNMKAVTATVELTARLIEEGTIKFADFVVKVSEVVGAATARKLEEYLVAAWEISGETNPQIDASGKVADVLGPEQKATVDDGRPSSSGSRDEGVGGSPGESGGALAPEAGELPEDGSAEGVSGRDDASVSERGDGPAETGTGSSGLGVDGDRAGASAGAEPETGRDPAVAAGGEAVVGVPGAVARNLNNLRIQPEDTIAPNGAVSKLRANIAAIKLLKSLESEGRAATDDEKRVLMQYTGWGSLANAFDEFRGEAYLTSPGLPSMYGEGYSKGQMYQQKGQFLSEEQLRKRVESWEKQWGEAYKYLKQNLTADEWKSSAASTANAHFTSRTVVTHGIWDALERLGVTGGRFLEPSAGVGNLIGLMPELVSNNSEVIAVELDSLTGRILEKLYPDASVYVQGLEDTPLPANSIDVAATNVPFSADGPADAETRYGRPMNLHNYFIARILDALRPGGIAAVISTHFTMDANPQDRALLASKGDLIGAIRLPNNAFQQNAGTEVTTDILFFRKPDGSAFTPQAWGNLATVGEDQVIEKGKPKRIPIVANEYFAAHPEMVLGTHSLAGEMYGDAASKSEYTLDPVEGADLAAQLQKAVANLPENLATQDTATPMPSMEVGTSGVEGRIDLQGGKLLEFVGKAWVTPAWLRDSVELVKDGSKKRNISPQTLVKKLGEAVKQATAYVKVRNAYEKHLANMLDKGTSEADYKSSQKALNDTYDSYRKSFGEINYKDSRWLERDPGFFLTSGLELENFVTTNGQLVKSWAKADVFRERTIQTVAPPTKADSIEEAVKLSLAWHGRLNLSWMSELTGSSSETIRGELLSSGVVFENPETGLLEPGDTYLAGNVHAKLRAAEQSVKDGNPDHAKNVESLKAIQPEKVTIDVITPSLGAPWIPVPLVNRWIHERIGMADVGVSYNEKADIWSVLGRWHVPQDIQNNWGTAAVRLSDLLGQVINGQSTRVMKEEPNGTDSSGRPKYKLVVDDKETQAAGAKAEKLRRDFEQWIKSDEAAIREVEQAYNEQKNFYVRPKWDGSHMTYPGMAPEWQKRMRPYQKSSVWRAIREGRGMIAHGVGAGKTVELIATAMEMKRLGTAKKPMIVVQNSTLGQFARTFTQVYPTAKVLVAGPEDLNKRNRAKFMARIASGNWDAVVMAKSSFNDKLPNDPQREKEMIEGLIGELKAVAAEYAASEGDKSPSVKAIQKQIKALEKRLQKVLDKLKERNDDDVFFEQLGIDALFLDEAHDYKKPPFVTKLDKNIKGVTTEVSGRALSALVKMRFIQGSHGGRNTFMATGTPITNTLGEAWLLMNMVAPDVNQEFGVETFDRFVALFARVGESDEQNSVGKWVRRTRLAKFKNGHQLGQFIASGWDVLLGSPLHEQIREYGGGSVPKLENGKETLWMVERSPAFDRFHKFLVEVFDAYSALSGEDKREYSWVPVTIYGAAKAAAIDIRLIDPTAPDDPGSKVNLIVNEVAKAFHAGTDKKLTQLIFSDVKNRATMDKLRAFAAREAVLLERAEDEDIDEDAEEDAAPAAEAADGDSWLYREIKRKLVDAGVPEDQVQLIEDHRKTPAALLAFQDKVNAGDVRIVIGHSDTLGTGVNVQERLEQTWELDIPMVPYKREQRLGRMIRSGNTNEIVKANVMGMKQSLDGPLMELNLRKSKFAEQALMGKLGGEFDDPYSESLMSMEDMMASMNDDPLFFRVRDLEFNIRGMKWEKEALDDQKSGQRERLRQGEKFIESLEQKIDSNQKRADVIEEVLKSDPPIKVDGKEVAKADVEAVVRAALKKESERLSKAIQDSRIRPQTDHLAVDIEMGAIQFSILYAERAEVRQDDKGNPETHWVVSTSTVATMNKQELFRGRMTTWPTILKEIVGKPAELRAEIPETQKSIEKRKSENVKTAEFLAKPYERQIELENSEAELSQTKSLMVARDAGAKGTHAPAPSIPPMVSKAYNVAPTSTVLRPGEKPRGRSGRPVSEVEDDDLGPRGMPLSAGRNPVSGRRVKMEPRLRRNPPSGVNVTATRSHEVIQAVVDATTALGQEIPLRQGLFRGKHLRGQYKTLPMVARIRTAGDAGGATHELAHGMWLLLSNWNGTGIRPALSGPIRRELMGIAKALYPNGAPAGGYVEEGFADFLRLWVTDPKEAKRHAPQMVAWWEGHFLPAMPEFQSAIENARQLAKNYVDQGDWKLAGGQLVDLDDPKREVKKFSDRIKDQLTVEKLFEELEPLRQVDLASEALLGRKLTFGESPYQQAKHLRMTQHGIVDSAVKKGVYGRDNVQLAPALEDVGKIIPEAESWKFKLYLLAKHGLELWDDPRGPRNPGIPREVAERIVNEVEADPETMDRYPKAGNIVWTWADAWLTYSGQLSPLLEDHARRLRSNNWKFYVPMSRDFGDMIRVLRGGSGSVSSAASSGELVKRLKGSGLPVKDMIPTMIADATKKVAVANSRVVYEGLNELSKIQGMNLFEDVPVDLVPVTHRTIGQLVAEVEKHLNPGEELSKEWEDSADTVVTFFSQGSRLPTGQPILPMMELRVDAKGNPVLDKDGNPIWELHWKYVSEEMLELMNGGMDVESASIMRTVLSATTALFKAGTVTYSPQFAVSTNLPADWRTFLKNTKSDKSVAELVPKMAGSLFESLLHGVTNGKFTTDAIEFWERNGGPVSQRMGQESAAALRAGRDVFGHTLKDRAKRLHVRLIGSDFLRYLRDVFAFSDAGYRVLEMKLMAQERGIDLTKPQIPAESMEMVLAGQEVTVDHRSAGKSLRKANSIWPFLMVPINSARASYRGFKDHPTRFLSRVAYSMAWGIALWLWNKDDDEYEELLPDEKVRYNHLKLFGKWVKIPRRDVDLFGAGIEMGLESWYREDPRAAEAWAYQVVESFVPSPPPLIEEGVEQWAGKDRFTGRDIVDRELAKRSAIEQRDEFTSRAAILIAETLNLGSIPASPKRIDHAVRGLFGRVPMEVLTAIGLGPGVPESDFQLSDVPAVGGVFRRGGQFPGRLDSVEQFYAKRSEMEKRENSERNPLSPIEKQQKRMLDDAATAMKLLSKARTASTTNEQRDVMATEMIKTAKEAIEQVDSGKLTDKRKASLVYEATSSLKGVSDDTVERRQAAREALSASGMTVDEQLAALKSHWLADRQADEDRKAKLKGRTPKKVMKLHFDTDAARKPYEDRQRLIRKGLE